MKYCEYIEFEYCDICHKITDERQFYVVCETYFICHTCFDYYTDFEIREKFEKQ